MVVVAFHILSQVEAVAAVVAVAVAEVVVGTRLTSKLKTR